MSQRFPKRATKAERAYTDEMRRHSAFDLVDRGQAQVLIPNDYPEPLKRFLMRERRTLHIPVSAAMKRKLEQRSKETGVSVEELARTWIREGMKRHTA